MANWKKTFELFLETKLIIFNIQILLINNKRGISKEKGNVEQKKSTHKLRHKIGR